MLRLAWLPFPARNTPSPTLIELINVKPATLTLLFALLFAMLSPLHAGDTPLTAARKGFTTQLLRQDKADFEPDTPPPWELSLTSYEGPLGKMAAYVSPKPRDGKRHPAVIWLTGGFSNSISAIAWTPGPTSNDQSASGFREAGIVMMYPSLRGGNQNPGSIETFLGEVDDVIAAARHLASLDYVDPTRIYLGGHSTGGTLALLVAASTNQFRAVFSLGPVDDILGYGSDVLPFDTTKPKEAQLRSPLRWMPDITSRTFVFEGEGRQGNIDELRKMSAANRNPRVSFHPIKGGSHFSIIHPLVRQISQQILEDKGELVGMEFKPREGKPQ